MAAQDSSLALPGLFIEGKQEPDDLAGSTTDQHDEPEKPRGAQDNTRQLAFRPARLVRKRRASTQSPERDVRAKLADGRVPDGFTTEYFVPAVDSEKVIAEGAPAASITPSISFGGNKDADVDRTLQASQWAHLSGDKVANQDLPGTDLEVASSSQKSTGTERK